LISLIGRVLRYFVAFVVLSYFLTQVIDGFVTDDFILQLANFFGSEGI